VSPQGHRPRAPHRSGPPGPRPAGRPVPPLRL